MKGRSWSRSRTASRTRSRSGPRHVVVGDDTVDIGVEVEIVEAFEPRWRLRPSRPFGGSSRSEQRGDIRGSGSSSQWATRIRSPMDSGTRDARDNRLDRSGENVTATKTTWRRAVGGDLSSRSKDGLLPVRRRKTTSGFPRRSRALDARRDPVTDPTAASVAGSIPGETRERTGQKSAMAFYVRGVVGELRAGDVDAGAVSTVPVSARASESVMTHSGTPVAGSDLCPSTRGRSPRLSRASEPLVVGPVARGSAHSATSSTWTTALATVPRRRWRDAHLGVGGVGRCSGGHLANRVSSAICETAGRADRSLPPPSAGGSRGGRRRRS